MICGLLLAAGSSTRFGQNKLAKRLPNDLPMALASAKSMRSVVDSMSVVVNSGDKGLMYSRESITVVSCPQSHMGMGHSISCGIAHNKNADGWVIALADMPFIKSGTIQSLVYALRQGALITVPTFNGRRGHPVGFSKKLYSELVALRGDKGARSVMEKYDTYVEEILCDDPGVLIDIDQSEDFEKYCKEFFSN